jgi:DNA polymerase
MNDLHVDLETLNPVLDLRKVGHDRYARDSGTRIALIGFAIDDEPARWCRPGEEPPKLMAALADPDVTIHAWNAPFEISFAEHNADLAHWPKIPLRRWYCSMARSQARALPAALEHVGKALGLAVRKDLAGKRLMQRLTCPLRKGETLEQSMELIAKNIDAFGRYCCTDVETEREASRALPPLPDREQTIWLMTQVQNRRGIRLDAPMVRAASKLVAEAQRDLHRAMAEATNGEVKRFTELGNLKAWIERRGISVDSLDKAGIEKLLGGPLPGEVRLALEIRQQGSAASAKKPDAMLRRMGANDRVCGSFRYHAAHTGRYGNTGVAFQNMRRLNGVNVDAVVAAVTSGDMARVRGLGNPLDVVGGSCRLMVISASDRRFVAADSSMIEARVAAWLVPDTPYLTRFWDFDNGRSDFDPYTTEYSGVFGVAPANVTPEQRQVGKVLSLSLLFGGGRGAFQTMAKGHGVTVPDGEAEEIKVLWRSNHPAIVEFWRLLDAAAVAAVWAPGSVHKVGEYLAFKKVDNFLCLRLPSSRRLSFPFPKLKATGFFDRYAVSYMDAGGGQFREFRNGAGLYGGLLFENAVQAVARDVLCEAMLRAERAHYPVIYHAHDELVAEIPSGRGSIEEFEQLVTTPPSWAPDLPLAAKCWQGSRYLKG